MRKREFMSPLGDVPVRVGSADLLVNAVSGDQVHVRTPDDGVAVRGVRLTARETYFLDSGEWKSWTDEKTNHRMSVRVAATYRDGSDAQRRAIQSLFRQAAESFAASHPLMLSEAAMVAANNEAFRADEAFAKAEKAYTLALDERDATVRRFEEARDAFEAAKSGEPSPGPGMR